MKSLENPLEDDEKTEMIPKYSFLLLLTFEGVIEMRNFANFTSLIQVTDSLVSLTLGCEGRTMFVACL